MSAEKMSNLHLKLLLLLYFLISYSIAIYWHQSGYFSVLDIFFDADPITNLASTAHAWGRHVVTHAFLELFSIPIRAIEYVFSSLDLVANKKEFREILALSISPIFSTLNILIFYLLLKRLNIKSYDVIILTLIFTFAFSNLIFSFIPETFSISGLLICTTIYYFITCSQNTYYDRPYIWLILATLLCGITITNIFIFAIIYFVYLMNIDNKPILYSLFLTSIQSIAGVFIVIGVYLLCDRFLNIQKDNIAGLSYLFDFFTDTRHQILSNMANFLNSTIHSILGTLPSISESKHNSTFASNSLTLIRTENLVIWITYPIILICIIAHAIYKDTERKHKNLYIICASIIVYNFSLHALFGKEIFLYSQHWLAPLCLLLIPLLKNRKILSTSTLLLIASINISILMEFDSLILVSTL